MRLLPPEMSVLFFLSCTVNTRQKNEDYSLSWSDVQNTGSTRENPEPTHHPKGKRTDFGPSLVDLGPMHCEAQRHLPPRTRRQVAYTVGSENTFVSRCHTAYTGHSVYSHRETLAYIQYETDCKHQAPPQVALGTQLVEHPQCAIPAAPQGWASQRTTAI